MRQGVSFDLGTPHITRESIWYTWPHRDFNNFKATFLQRRKELGNHLLTRAREMATDPRYEVETSRSLPGLQNGMNAEIIHISHGGRWIVFEPGIGGDICSFHNIDYMQHKIFGFNLAADCLEYMDTGVLAPRIIFNPPKYTLQYPLPGGLKAISPQAQTFIKERGSEIARAIGIGSCEGINSASGKQEIRMGQGSFTVEDGVLRWVDGDIRTAIRSTYLAATICDACNSP